MNYTSPTGNGDNLPRLFHNLIEVHAADIRKVRGFSEDLVRFSLAEPDEQTCGRAFVCVNSHINGIIAAGFLPFFSQL